MSEAAARDFASCAQIARANAKNFYYAFAILPRPRREAMYAVYAFCRRADDIVDEPGPAEAKREALASYRAALDAAFDGRPEGPVFRALSATVRRYGLAREHLAHVIEGCEMDLERNRYETFDALARYSVR